MRLKSLELLIWVEIGILVIEAYDHSNVYEIGLHVIEEGARISARIDWPAYCVLYVARLEKTAAWIHLPNLFQTQSIKLRIAFIS